MIPVQLLTRVSLFLIAFSELCNAQQRLNFPRVLTVEELSTTGIALVNTSPSAVAATFNFYGSDGVLATRATLSVPAGGQVAKLASGILPNAASNGWIQILSSSAELQGFQLIGDFATVVDGTGPAPEARQLAVIDFSKEDIAAHRKYEFRSGHGPD
jgi:hypothetical protein